MCCLVSHFWRFSCLGEMLVLRFAFLPRLLLLSLGSGWIISLLFSYFHFISNIAGLIFSKHRMIFGENPFIFHIRCYCVFCVCAAQTIKCLKALWCISLILIAWWLLRFRRVIAHSTEVDANPIAHIAKKNYWSLNACCSVCALESPLEDVWYESVIYTISDCGMHSYSYDDESHHWNESIEYIIIVSMRSRQNQLNYGYYYYYYYFLGYSALGFLSRSSLPHIAFSIHKWYTRRKYTFSVLCH